MLEDLHILVKKCKDNDRVAQSKIYQTYSGILFSVCLRYSDNYEDAQDSFQEGFIQIFNKIDQYRFDGSFEGWMRRVMVNTCLHRHRTKTHLYLIDEKYHNTSENEDSQDLMIDHELEYIKDLTFDELLAIINQLPERYRQVFNLYVIDQVPHQKIAEMLQISVGTSKSNLSRAKDKLRELIKNNQKVKAFSK